MKEPNTYKQAKISSTFQLECELFRRKYETTNPFYCIGPLGS